MHADIVCKAAWSAMNPVTLVECNCLVCACVVMICSCQQMIVCIFAIVHTYVSSLYCVCCHLSVCLSVCLSLENMWVENLEPIRKGQKMHFAFFISRELAPYFSFPIFNLHFCSEILIGVYWWFASQLVAGETGREGSDDVTFPSHVLITHCIQFLCQMMNLFCHKIQCVCVCVNFIFLLIWWYVIMLIAAYASGSQIVISDNHQV